MPDEQTQQEEKPQARFPVIDRPNLLIDDSNATFWVGLPLRHLEFVEVQVILGRLQSDIYNWYKSHSIKNRIINPFRQSYQATKDFLAGNGK